MWNAPLAADLAIDFSAEKQGELIAQYFSGNQLFDGSKPIAQAYSGHQFGHFNPQLGDGRAHLLGDVKDEQGQHWDIQLKGSGTSYFSRSGDGRCALGPAIREFIMSEAMFALGVPTTRCLAVVATGEGGISRKSFTGCSSYSSRFEPYSCWYLSVFCGAPRYRVTEKNSPVLLLNAISLKLNYPH